MIDIYGIGLDELSSHLVKHNQKPFRADQVYDWLYKKRVNLFESMTNINQECIQVLKDKYIFGDLAILRKQTGKNVSKYLFKLHDGETIEAVLMFHDYGTSLCISTQVGCNMGCVFCESGRLKRVRNLTASEMVLQILKIEHDLDQRISHVVLMGIGEPFDNYDEVMTFIKIITDNKGINLGSRRITISTCGIIPKIEAFGDENLQVNLAVSLHAPNDEIRNKLMPINKAYKIADLVDSVKHYINKTNRRVTFEYIMLDDINDSEACAKQLASLLRGINCYVNLIPYNETNNIHFKKSDHSTIMRFYDILKRNNINVTIRREFGSEVDAACGQLRANN